MSNDLFDFQAIKETVKHSLTDLSAPFFLHPVIDFFEKGHVIYCWTVKNWTLWIKREKLKEANKGDPFVYGGLALLAHDSVPTPLSHLMRAALILKCIDALFDHHRRVHEAYNALNNAINQKYPVYKLYRWHKPTPKQQIILALSFHLWIQHHIIHIRYRILQVVHRAMLLLYEVLKTAICYRDVYLIATRDPNARFIAYTEIFASILECSDQWSNPVVIKQSLAGRINFVNKVLNKMKLPEISETMVETGAQVIEHVPSLLDTAQYILMQGGIFIPGKVTSLSPFPAIEQTIVPFESEINLTKHPGILIPLAQQINDYSKHIFKSIQQIPLSSPPFLSELPIYSLAHPIPSILT